MKQVIVLEAHEIAHLQRGKGLELSVGGASVLLRFDLNGHSGSELTCKKCGKVCKNERGLVKHTQVMHKGKE